MCLHTHIRIHIWTDRAQINVLFINIKATKHIFYCSLIVIRRRRCWKSRGRAWISISGFCFIISCTRPKWISERTLRLKGICWVSVQWGIASMWSYWWWLISSSLIRNLLFLLLWAPLMLSDVEDKQVSLDLNKLSQCFWRNKQSYQVFTYSACCGISLIILLSYLWDPFNIHVILVQNLKKTKTKNKQNEIKIKPEEKRTKTIYADLNYGGETNTRHTWRKCILHLFSTFPQHTHTLYTHLRICTHFAAAHRSTGEHWQVCSQHDYLPLNDGTILKAAAACPTAPSGAENQDNFIVIISLLLSPSLSLVEEEEKKEGQHEGEVR